MGADAIFLIAWLLCGVVAVPVLKPTDQATFLAIAFGPVSLIMGLVVRWLERGSG